MESWGYPSRGAGPLARERVGEQAGTHPPGLSLPREWHAWPMVRTCLSPGTYLSKVVQVHHDLPSFFPSDAVPRWASSRREEPSMNHGRKRSRPGKESLVVARTKSESSVLFARAVATGAFGTVLLVLFLENFVATATLARLVPVVVVFNAAVSGFSYTRNTERRRGDCPAALVAGGLCALVGLGALHLLGSAVISGESFDLVSLVLALTGSLLCGLAGSWLAANSVCHA